MKAGGAVADRGPFGRPEIAFLIVVYAWLCALLGYGAPNLLTSVLVTLGIAALVLGTPLYEYTVRLRITFLTPVAICVTGLFIRIILDVT